MQAIHQQPEKAEIMDKSKDIILAAVRHNLFLKLDQDGCSGTARTFGVEGAKRGGVFVLHDESVGLFQSKRKKPEQAALPQLLAHGLPKKARKAVAVSNSAAIVHCVCGRNEHSGNMLQCQRCEHWQHGHCVGIALSQASQRFFCSGCSGTALAAAMDDVEYKDIESDLGRHSDRFVSDLDESDLDVDSFLPEDSDVEEVLDFPEPRSPISSRPPSVTGSTSSEKSAAPTPRTGPTKVTERVCFVNPTTGQMLTGNRAPRRPETIKKYLAEGWVPLDSPRKKRAAPPPQAVVSRPRPKLETLIEIPRSPPKTRLVEDTASCKSTPRQKHFEWIGQVGTREEGKSFFTAFNYDAQRFCVGDFVYLQPNNPGEAHHIAKINSAWEISGRKQMSVQWFFRREETAFGSAASQDKMEIFASNAGDSCPVEAIAGRCQVMHSDDVEDWNQYRRQEHAYFFRQSYHPATRTFETMHPPMHPVRRPSALVSASAPGKQLLPTSQALPTSPTHMLPTLELLALPPPASRPLCDDTLDQTESLFGTAVCHTDDVSDAQDGEGFDIDVFLNLNDCLAY